MRPMHTAPRDEQDILLRWRDQWWKGYCDNRFDHWVIPSPNDTRDLRTVEPEGWMPMPMPEVKE